MNKLTQSRLLQFAAAFLFLQTLLITLSPAVRLRTGDVEYRFSQWLALFFWGLSVARAHYDISRKLPDADPYLFPAAAFISGWGLLTIWRLDPNFGLRQMVWFVISCTVLIAGTRLATIDFLHRYKYILLTSGLLLTTLTLLFGTNPSGNGPRLWLGCCDFYLQPSEPLKLLLVGFLAAYLADKLPSRLRTIHILYPTVILSGIVILLLVVQRDLGTASIFTALYTIIIYLATGRRRILLVALFLLAFVSIGGYYFVGIVHARVNSWLNPWNDPSGSSYQIVQSLIAIANGGVFGRGPGLGSPGFVPVAISDFIYAAIAEETGLLGTLGLLALMGLIVVRGLRAALRAPDLFRRILAAGISAYFGVQTILIVGGNLRLLPLTGVTLPFVSYGGSSLLTSFLALLVLLNISNHLDVDPAPLPKPQPYLIVSAFLALGLFAAALTNGWWSVIRDADLLTRSDNPRRVIEERFVPRGLLLDSSNTIINTNHGDIGSYSRDYRYVDLAPVTGYIDPIYGQAGLEDSLDEYLRGTKGNPASTLLWSNLLYGMNPKGLDVRLSLDLYLQNRADEMMIGHSGAVVLLNAKSGEIIVMASHPTFNPNHLIESGTKLLTDPQKPLINRATLGQYPLGSILKPFERAIKGNKSNNVNLTDIYNIFGLNQPPQIQLPVSPITAKDPKTIFHVSPLQMALASAALSNHGVIPAPRIAMAVNTPAEGWISLSALGKPIEAVQASAADEAASFYVVENQSYWQAISQIQEETSAYTWFIAGSPPNWQATPLVIVVILEENNVRLAERLGHELLVDAMHP